MKVVRTQPVFEDSSVVFLARIRDTDGAYPPAIGVSSIIITAFDLADVSNKIIEVTLAPPFTGNWFDALQTGDLWNVDNVGYNYKYVSEASHLPDGDRVIRFDHKYLFANGKQTHQAWDVPTLDLKRS